MIKAKTIMEEQNSFKLLGRAETLAQEGLEYLSHSELWTRGERYKANNWDHWYAGSSGEHSYVREVDADKAALILIAKGLAEKAGIPWPNERVLRYRKENGGVGFLCVFPMPGKEQQTLLKFEKSAPSKEAIKQVSESFSYLVPFLSFIGLALGPADIAIASWPDRNGKNVQGVCVLGPHDLRFSSSEPVYPSWIREHKAFLPLDERAYALGAGAVVVSDEDIKDVVKEAYGFCFIDPGWTSRLPPAEQLINQLLQSRSAPVIPRALMERLVSIGKSLVYGVFGRSPIGYAEIPTRPKQMPVFGREGCLLKCE